MTPILVPVGNVLADVTILFIIYLLRVLPVRVFETRKGTGGRFMSLV